MRWFDRAVRAPGPERVALVQAIKATGAAVLAWVVASRVFDFSQPFLAPWSAIFIVEATVYRSVRSAAQQISAVTVAVVLTTAVAAVIPWELLTLTVAVLVGLLIGQWHRFGESGPWIGITALLLLTSGATAETLLVERLAETVLGAGIGLVINATIFPPVYGDTARRATHRLATELAALLTDLATVLRENEPPPHADAWARQAKAAIGLVRQAERAVEWSAESRRLNLRQRVVRLGTPTEDPGWVFISLRNVWPYVEEIAQAVRTVVEHQRPFVYPDTVSRTGFAEVLDRLADVVRLRGEGHSGGADFDAAVESARSALDDLDDRLEAPETVTFGSAAGVLAMLLPARHALRELTTF
ncbi:aromatic acid exporter family protein [Rhodococcus sp. T2V]|nr:aromatic acid exporter family protein [Rhodococcus sp. T2V]